MKQEKPVEVIQGKSRKHKVETRVFSRRIHESFCMQPGCKFRGKHAQQGVCHTTETFAGGSDWKYIDAVAKSGESFLKELRAVARANGCKSLKAQVKYFESCLVVEYMNTCFTLDSLIRLRRENALLKLKLDKKRR